MKHFKEFSRMPPMTMARDNVNIGVEAPQKESYMTWKNGIISDGTMSIGIFDSDVDKAKAAAQALVQHLRKYKNVKIGGEKEDGSGPNDEIAKYSEELSKLVFDDEILDNLEPNGKNSKMNANKIVLKRLKKLGVKIK
jgi:hypothetical protein